MRIFAAILSTLLLAVPPLLAAQPPTYRGRSVAQWSDDLSHPNTVVRVEAGKMLGRLGTHAVEAVDPLIAALSDRNPDVRLHAAAALGRIKHNPQQCLAALTGLLEDKDEHVRFAAEWSLARIAQDVAKEQHTHQDAETLGALLAAAETALANSARDLKHLQQIADARKTLKTPTVSTDNHAQPLPRNQPPGADDVRALLANLQADDKITQLKAIAELRRLGRTAEMVEAWQIVGDDEFIRWHLTRELAKIGKPAVPALAQALRGEVELVGLQAAHCLRQMGPTAIGSLPQLLAVIEDQDVTDDLREAAISAIESIGPSAEAAVETLTEVLKSDAPEWVIGSSMRALVAIGPAAHAAEPTLLDILRDEDQPEQVRTGAAQALTAIGPTSNQIRDTLIAMIRDNDGPYFVSCLADSLGKYGETAAPAVPRLVELLDSTSDIERQWIIQTLGNIGSSARQATPRLIECLTDVEEFDMVKVAAAKSLGQLGDDAIVSLAEQLEHPNPQVRRAITRALIEIGEQAKPAVKPLELRLVDRDEDTQVQSLVAVALGEIGPDAKSAIPTLTRILGDVRQAVYLRAMAAVSIGQIDPGQSPTLIAALNDSEPEIRVAAAYALQRLPTPHPDAIGALIRELEDEAARGMAMHALRDFKQESRPLLTDVANDRTKETETRVACLALIGENGLDATEQLLEALNDRTLAESAYWSLRDLGNDSIPFLMSAADNEEKYNEEALGAIHELIEELYGGIGGGEGDDVWSGGHALVQGLDITHHPAAKMATAAPKMMGRSKGPAAEAAMMSEPEEVPRPEPAPDRGASEANRGSGPDAALTPPPVEPETGYKSVKVFYGTNRQATGDTGKTNGAQIPWYVWLFIVGVFAGLLIFVFKQFRRRDTGRTIVGVAGIILFSLAVEAATTRIQRLHQTLDKSGPTYGTEYSSEVKMGLCEVTIPDVHQEGQVERPSILRLQVVEDREKHIVIKNVQQLEPDAFFADLQSELGQRGNSILVFVHGYNVSFEKAARRTAQMSNDLKFAGAAVFYSWPSQANWRKYRVDEKNVELSINQLKTFLLDVAQRSNADTINLIAHSMGNRALTHALKEIEVTASEQEKLFNQVILAAPDIDADIFRERIAPAIVHKARHITLYASSKDYALVASREFNSGDPRAGDAGADLVVVPGIETIDVSAGASSLLGHSYYGDSTSVLYDIEFLLRDQPAAERRFLEPYPRLEPTHWLFQPAVTARRSDHNDARR